MTPDDMLEAAQHLAATLRGLQPELKSSSALLD